VAITGRGAEKVQLLYRDLKLSLSIRLLYAKVMSLICIAILVGMFPFLCFVEFGSALWSFKIFTHNRIFTRIL